MSRIGKKPVLLSTGVETTIGGQDVVVQGPKGTLTVKLPPHAQVALQSDPRALVVTVEHPDHVGDRAIWGLTRQLLQNAVDGVQKPFEKLLEFVGVGFKVALEGRTLTLDVGLSHKVSFSLPVGVEAKVEKQIVTLASIDKHLVGEIAAQLRRVKPPEPYKGKGIKYVDEVIRRKAGKTAKTAA
ncbi:50S ribosomal protein L6 [Candidatus Uhrbacteria bacterium]|nr:50S ribosomal protein L6 [Candidatus Uhrbacteria bacterium]